MIGFIPNDLNNIIFNYHHQLMMKNVFDEMGEIFKTNIKVCSHCNEKKFHIHWSSCFECEDENICTKCSEKYTKKIEDVNVPICHFCFKD